MFVLLTPTRKHALETTNRKKKQQQQKQTSWFWPTLLLPTFMPLYLSKNICFPVKANLNVRQFFFLILADSFINFFFVLFLFGIITVRKRPSLISRFNFLFSFSKFLSVCDTFWLSFSSVKISMFCFCRLSLSRAARVMLSLLV